MSKRAQLRQVQSCDIPDQRPFQGWKKEHKGRLLSDQAIVTTVHHCFRADRVPGHAAEGWQEWHWENGKIEAGRRADVQVDRALFVSCICPRHY